MSTFNLRYGSSTALHSYTAAFTELAEIHAEMRATQGYTLWWGPGASFENSIRRPTTFLNSAESILGFHLRRSGLGCHELRSGKGSGGGFVQAGILAGTGGAPVVVLAPNTTAQIKRRALKPSTPLDAWLRGAPTDNGLNWL